MIEAIIFDMGGVLVDEGPSRERLAEFDQILGWEAGTMVQHLYGGAPWQLLSRGEISVDDFWQEMGEPLADALPADFEEFRDNFHAHPLIPSTVTLAWRLKRRYRIALLSNATTLLPARLRKEKRLHGLFDVVVISALVGLRKPDPEIFDLTAQRLGLPPVSCLLIDDKQRNVDAALAAGMQAIIHEDPARLPLTLKALGLDGQGPTPAG